MATDCSITNLFVYLVGFAGTGKLTIGRALAGLIGAKVVDNQWINNTIFGLIDCDGVTPLPEGVRPSAPDCSSASIPPMQSTRVVTMSCLIRSRRGL
jgi:hypothetical protein